MWWRGYRQLLGLPEGRGAAAAGTRSPPTPTWSPSPSAATKPDLWKSLLHAEFSVWHRSSPTPAALYYTRTGTDELTRRIDELVAPLLRAVFEGIHRTGVAGSGNWWTELPCVADAVPPLCRDWGGEPSCADRRFGVSDATEHCDRALPSAAHNSGHGADYRFDVHAMLASLGSRYPYSMSGSSLVKLTARRHRGGGTRRDR